MWPYLDKVILNSRVSFSKDAIDVLYIYISFRFHLQNIHDLVRFLLQAICGIIRSTTEAIFSAYIGKFQIQSIDFESLTLGTLPPTVHGKL